MSHIDHQNATPLRLSRLLPTAPPTGWPRLRCTRKNAGRRSSAKDLHHTRGGRHSHAFSPDMSTRSDGKLSTMPVSANGGSGGNGSSAQRCAQVSVEVMPEVLPSELFGPSAVVTFAAGPSATTYSLAWASVHHHSSPSLPSDIPVAHFLVVYTTESFGQ